MKSIHKILAGILAIITTILAFWTNAVFVLKLLGVLIVVAIVAIVAFLIYLAVNSWRRSREDN